MKFRCGLHRPSVPSVETPCVVALKAMYHAEGGPTRFDMVVSVYADIDGDGDPDSVVQINDVQRHFSATEDQLQIIGRMMRGSDNLIAVLRGFLKNQYAAHNSTVYPSAAPFWSVDLDTDAPIDYIYPPAE